MGKPLDQLSPAYRKRIERAMAKGKTRQQARGHKAQEHKIRAAREIQKYNLTKAQMKIIAAFVERNKGTKGWDEDGFIDYFRGRGYSAFKDYRAVWEVERRRYLKEGSTGKGLEYLDFLTAAAGVDDAKMLYYH